jgi:outer membrane lipoprotein
MRMNTLNSKPALLALLPALLLSACASAPTFNTTGVDPFLTPQSVTTSPQAATGKRVQWGGTIIDTANLQDRTQIEVLAYPLDSKARPQSESSPLGRFFLEQSGFLDPATYKQGRQISAVGTVTGTRTSKVGEASYEQPVVDGMQIYLWPENQGSQGTGVTFGIGGGSGGWGSGTSWGVGVGTGF